MQYRIFEFESFDIQLDKRLLTFHYCIHTDGEPLRLTEKLILPDIPYQHVSDNLLQSLGAQLHVALGISYWKLFCPKEIKITSTQLNKSQAEFWNCLYTKGLGEFYYRNNIDYRGLVSFPYTNVSHMPLPYPRSRRSLVGVGGGKDSIVSIELLKKSQKAITAYIVKKQEYGVIDATLKISQVEALSVQRIIDPQLVNLSKQNDAYNGHVPISSIYAFVGVLLALLYDYSYVISSNEQSANYGNVDYLGLTVNHQWSKSEEFEKMFRDFIHAYITPDITYFSLLRVWHEIKIADEFTKYPSYFDSFSSCNRNFSSTNPNLQGLRWCGECPKCAFVFAIFAAFLPKSQLIAIFGHNLFDVQKLVPLYKELLGMAGFKPFECVGTPEETKIAFWMAHNRHEFDEDVVMKMFTEECLPQMSDIPQMKEQVFAYGDDAFLPEEFKGLLKH